MAKYYSKERSKYGSGAGTIITWPVEITTLDPNNDENRRVLPAGYLKCDGSKYLARLYPVLAEICGVGSSSKFIRYDIEGEPIDTPTNDEFIVPDLGSKFLKPTTGGSAGSYINILSRNQLGIEKSRSGMGILSSISVGSTIAATTTIPLTYSGNFVIPSQAFALRGKPSWTVGTNNTAYTDVESVDAIQLHPHMHFSTTNRLRIKTTNEVTGTQANGTGYRKVGSTIPIQGWMDNTRYDNLGSNPPGTNQFTCWGIASGIAAGQVLAQGYDFAFLSEYIWHNLCYNFRTTDTNSPGLNTLRYNCLLNAPTAFDLDVVQFAAPPTEFETFISLFGGFACLGSSSKPLSQARSSPHTVPATYIEGALGVPSDYNGVSLHDVVPFNNNSASKTLQVGAQVNNVATEIAELVQTDGDPTVHSHKITIEKLDHTYQIKTAAYLLSPDNLKTVLTMKTSQVASLDQVTGPYIILEYLIKY